MGVIFKPDLTELRRRIAGQLAAINQGTANPTIAAGLKKAGAEYLAFTRKGFESRTAGGWQPLKPSTEKQRARQGFSPARPILFRNGDLFRALYPGAPGNLFRLWRDGIRVGYDIGGTHHPKYPDGSGGNLTIGQIALIHQTGAGLNPRRQILYPPDLQTQTLITNAIQSAINIILSK